MIDPSAAALLDAVANTLTNQVVPASTGSAQHSARVAANLCRIIARELESTRDPVANAEICRLLGLPTDADPDEAWSSLDKALQSGDPELSEASLPLVRAVVEHELSITKPTYLDGAR